jgi:hypothetical protein
MLGRREDGREDRRKRKKDGNEISTNAYRTLDLSESVQTHDHSTIRTSGRFYDV